jgi:hypothetical protein
MLLSLNKAPCDAFSTWRPRSATGIRKFCEWPLSAQMVEDRPLTRKQYEPVNGIQFLRVEAALGTTLFQDKPAMNRLHVVA